ncbi:hypothetical protein ManeNPV_00065 [Malacosoma neustria nucleopolyhedrovirus]|uniref:hypothetical protein n=1 Tax=Malacosoma neustria nuclear polyhedrosis virus TaxID=38012 RepID=UPI000E35A5D9|nr:hypothetical protein ManeNPV_00065 [Malacosoma neustria nucleopolyhedrovirus]AUF81592.1 hypothetical protein ManeNPV_00065 [Malacosoma neustria nucleopolyhedrovirus]
MAAVAAAARLRTFSLLPNVAKNKSLLFVLVTSFEDTDEMLDAIKLLCNSDVGILLLICVTLESAVTPQPMRCSILKRHDPFFKTVGLALNRIAFKRFVSVTLNTTT